jgi:hypothetical protein
VRPPVGLLARWGPDGSSLAGYDTSNKVLLVSPYVQHMDTQVRCAHCYALLRIVCSTTVA